MGGGNRKKQPQHLSKQQREQRKVDQDIHLYNQLLINDAPRPLFKSWKEVTMLCVVLGVIGAASVFMGIAFGLSLGINSEQEQPESRRSMKVKYRMQAYTDRERLTIVLKKSKNVKLGEIWTADEKENRNLITVVEQNIDRISPFNSYDLLTDSPLCQDGEPGFADFESLKNAVQEINLVSAQRFIRWKHFFIALDGHELGAFEDNSMYYEQLTYIAICPDTTIRTNGLLILNAENVVLECEGCTFHVDGGGPHISFGPDAKNVLVRGITFTGAGIAAPSLLFHFDGASARFEDCFWSGGTVADVNSTASVAFHRCETADTPAHEFASSLKVQSRR